MTVLASGTLGAGFTAFIVVLALVIATVFLFRSMSKHLRKVPPTFEQSDDAKQGDDDTP
jgi:hypothetical protein